uniref:Prenyl transferase n=1 Tax=Glaucocystis incrassata TaxID=1789788 RepID=A0A3G1IVJ7_9EUKA|nr:prenyl transferase [Glaucocystis incrassata]ASQ40063.1 prenyl transferase [Glaucocystis incrassata]
MSSNSSLFSSIENDLNVLTRNLNNLVNTNNPLLSSATEYLFLAGGKRLRPAIVLLVSKATMGKQELRASHLRLAEISEILHTASLVHDDVLDDSILRRGVPSVHNGFGTKIAVLAGDFLFAQSSWYLANLDSLEVVKLISKVIIDFAEGEIRQGLNEYNSKLSIEEYLEKSFYKTASLIAASTKSAAILSQVAPSIAEDLYHYGRHLGLAFQIVDDILDFTSSTETLGKPASSDLIKGNLTAPVLFALQKNPTLSILIQRRFSESTDFEQAISIVKKTKGIEKARDLAMEHAQVAIECLHNLPNSESTQALKQLVEYVLERIY